MGRYEMAGQRSEAFAYEMGSNIWIVLVFTLFSVLIAHNSLVALHLTPSASRLTLLF
jgi:hypothetical protein